MSAVLQNLPPIDSAATVPAGLAVSAREPGQERLLTPDALSFLAGLHRAFEAARQDRLAARRQRQAAFDAGALPDFRSDTAAIRSGDWQVGPIPKALLDRRVEITGPVDPKMVINALNSGAQCYMADFEDSTSPTWRNLLTGQPALRRAASRSWRTASNARCSPARNDSASRVSSRSCPGSRAETVSPAGTVAVESTGGRFCSTADMRWLL